MQHLPTLEVMTRALRKEVCPQCTQREGGNDWPDLTKARPCEAACTIFLNLTQVRTIVEEVHGKVVTPYEHAIREMVCQHCNSSPTAGDFCDDRASQRCPLSRYTPLVIDVLERVERTR